MKFFFFFFFWIYSVMRSVVVAMTVAVTLPMIYTYGIAVSYTLCAVLIWVSYRYVIVPEKKKKKGVAGVNDISKNSGLYYVIKYGDEMRAWVDIGFSSIEDNSKIILQVPDT